MDSTHLSPNTNGFSFTREDRGGAVVFICRGAMLLNYHPDLDRLIVEAQPGSIRGVVLDLTAVTRIDSVGVGTLAKILRAALAGNCPLVLVPNQAIREALAQASLDRAFTYCDSIEAALLRTSR